MFIHYADFISKFYSILLHFIPFYSKEDSVRLRCCWTAEIQGLKPRESVWKSSDQQPFWPVTQWRNQSSSLVGEKRVGVTRKDRLWWKARRSEKHFTEEDQEDEIPLLPLLQQFWQSRMEFLIYFFYMKKMNKEWCWRLSLVENMFSFKLDWLWQSGFSVFSFINR